MTNKLPEIGVKYSWKHAPQRYFLVIGFFKDQIVCIQDRYLDNTTDDEALECAELMTLAGFKCVTSFKRWSEDNSSQATSAENTQIDEVEKAKEELNCFMRANDEISYGVSKESQKLGKQYVDLFEKAQNLLNALDNIKTQAEPVDNKIDWSEEKEINYKEINYEGEGYLFKIKTGVPSTQATSNFGKNKTETKLLWKNVSELPKEDCDLMFNWFGEFKHYSFGKFNLGEFYHVPQGENQRLGLVEANLSEYVRKSLKYCTLTDLINSIESMLSRQYELEERIKKLEGK